MITYPAIVYGLRDGTYMMDIPNLKVSVTGKDFMEIMERSDEVVTGIVMYRAMRKQELPVASRGLRPKNTIKSTSVFKTIVCVSKSHYQNMIYE